MGPVGAQGVDLKETEQLIGLSSHWNEASMRQVEGRVSRHGSHACPDVEVPCVFLQLSGAEDLPDERMQCCALEKEALIEPVMAALREKAAAVGS